MYFTVVITHSENLTKLINQSSRKPVGFHEKYSTFLSLHHTPFNLRPLLIPLMQPLFTLYTQRC